MPLKSWVNLIEHLKDIGKSMINIKNDDAAVNARYKPGGDLIISNHSTGTLTLDTFIATKLANWEPLCAVSS